MELKINTIYNVLLWEVINLMIRLSNLILIYPPPPVSAVIILLRCA